MAPLRNAVVLGAMAALLILEHRATLAAARRGKLRRGGRHLVLAAINGLFVLVVVGALHGALWEQMDAYGLGLLNRLSLPLRLRGAAVLLLFDFWIYLWHRLNHMVPFLWRFHRVHHSDPEPDVTTALRFHVGQVALAAFFNLGALAVLGMGAADMLLYQTVAAPVLMLQHTDCRLPERWDRVLRLLLPTPRMHRLHHSREPGEKRSNFGALFSLWDRLLGSFRLPSDPWAVRCGLEGWDGPHRQSLRGLLTMPGADFGLPGPEGGEG